MTTYREVTTATNEAHNEFYHNAVPNAPVYPQFEPSFLNIGMPSTSEQAMALAAGPPVAPAPLPPPPTMNPYLHCLPSTSAQVGFAQLPVPPAGATWKCPDWLSHDNGLKQFSGADRMHFKRKMSGDIEPIRPKQLITDERMAAHLNSLHISASYTSHSGSHTASTSADGQFDGGALAEAATASAPSYAAMATHDLEEKLRNASRITICEEIRKLAAEPILPQAILERFERPCTALVLWQPPARITDHIVPKDVELRRKHDDAEQDNNNCMAIDFNSGDSMDLEEM